MRLFKVTLALAVVSQFSVFALQAVAAPSASKTSAPTEPLLVKFDGKDRLIGRRGGTLRTLMSKEKDVRLLNTWGYARLVGWTPALKLEADLVKSVEIKDNRVFTFQLRAGHRWSDGQAFTTEDFRYFWEDVASNKELSPGGPPVELLNDGEIPKVEIISPSAVRYSWSKPNSKFLASLAQAREPYIYRPAHYLKQFHTKYAKPAALGKMMSANKAQSWAQLHNRMDSMDDNDNPAMPTLQPWMPTTAMPATRFVFVRNPYFHRVDANGVQLPYIDRIEINITDSGLIAAKSAAGDSDLQARGLSFADSTVLKANETPGKYRVRFWPIAKASHLALYPNLNTNDPVWRAVLRDVRFRRALSLGINRQDINKALFFGLATEGNNTVLSSSPLYNAAYLTAHAKFDAKLASQLLDQVGLTGRNSEGIRLLSDQRPAELVIDTAGESKEETDVLQLIGQHLKAIGIKLVVKTSDRTVMRNRAYSGDSMMTAWAGWDVGIPTADMSPEELAPTRQDTLIWPKWGNHYETRGKSGSAPDMDVGRALLKLNADWNRATTAAQRANVWASMLKLHADNQLIIGTVSGVRQPIVVSARLANVPERGLFSWDPGAQFGMYRMDEFWFRN